MRFTDRAPTDPGSAGSTGPAERRRCRCDCGPSVQGTIQTNARPRRTSCRAPPRIPCTGWGQGRACGPGDPWLRSTDPSTACGQARLPSRTRSSGVSSSRSMQRFSSCPPDPRHFSIDRRGSRSGARTRWITSISHDRACGHLGSGVNLAAPVRTVFHSDIRGEPSHIRPTPPARGR